MASSAIPGVLPHADINGQAYSDGGVDYGVNVFGAVEACRALGAADHEITVDIVLCIGKTLSPLQKDPTTFHTIDSLLRGLEIKQYMSHMGVVNEAIAAAPQVNWRYNIWPSTPIPGTGFDFNHTAMMDMVALGQRDAKAAIAHGHGYGFKEFAQFEKKQPDVRALMKKNLEARAAKRAEQA